MIVTSLVLACPAVLPFLQDSTVRDFKRYFRRYTESDERVELVYALEGIDDPEVARVLIPVLDDRDPRVAQAATEVLSELPSEGAREPLRGLLDKPKAAGQVARVVQIAGQGGWRDFVPLIRPQLEHREEEVRLWAATAVGQLGDTESLEGLGELALGDRNKLVRVAAVDSIGKLGRDHRDVAGPLLVAALGDEALEVQTAACTGLQTVRVREAIAPLIDLMESGEGRILEEVYPTLIEITDLQFVDNPELWRQWWNKASEEYQIPTDEELAKRRKDRKQDSVAYRSSKTVASFVGVDTPSERVVFIIDVSASMEEMVLDRDHFAEGGHTRFGKLDIVKKEMVQTIEKLGGNVEFNVLAFASQVHSWKPKPVRANLLNRRSAADWVDRLQPIGGQSAQAQAAAGLSGSAALDEGKTNTYGALLAGLGVQGDEDASEEVKSEIDTVFFLSDGRPSVGKLVDPDDIQKGIHELNRFRRVTIHTIAIGEFQKDFLEYLARDNGGTFVDLGR